MTSSFIEILDDMVQGSPEWLALRKTKITATDASVIMGINPWKTKTQLYNEKISNDPPFPPNERMKRGLHLESTARDLFHFKTAHKMHPVIIVKDWTMASLDGMSQCRKYILEIKCPGEKDHAVALSGKVPEHYYPQLQHQMYVADVQMAYYFSFDGIDGIIIGIGRNDEYIEKMLIEEKKFYDCLMSKTPPEAEEKNYIERNDEEWCFLALRWKNLQEKKKDLEIEEEMLKEHLISLSGKFNMKGAGISTCQVTRKGPIDYANIPALKNLDLEQYRKPSTTSWRITCQ